MRKKWTKEHLENLKKYYQNSSWNKLEDLLYPFKKEDIIHKAYKLKIKKDTNKYTEKEVDFIKKNYNVLSIKEISEKLERSVSGIETKILRLGLVKSNKWTDEEIELLKVQFNKLKTSELPNLFKNRTKEAIYAMALKLGLKKENRHTKVYDEEKLLQDLIKFKNKFGYEPTLIDLQTNKDMASPITYNRYFGSYRTALKLAGLDIHYFLFGEKVKTYLSKNNDICYSKAEVMITNFFIDNNIKYEKEVKYSNFINDELCGEKRCDWKINDNIIVEFFGLPNKPKYKDKMNFKINICNKYNVELIELYQNDLTKLSEIFKQYIIK